MSQAVRSEFTEEWLLRAIETVSFCIVEDGVVYAPILERLEHELDMVRRKDDVVARARRNVELRNQRVGKPNCTRPAGSYEVTNIKQPGRAFTNSGIQSAD